jgi:hypothetical protein
MRLSIVGSHIRQKAAGVKQTARYSRATYSAPLCKAELSFVCARRLYRWSSEQSVTDVGRFLYVSTSDGL